MLREVGGQDAVALVEEVEDEGIKRIVESWPTRLNTSRAWELGFAPMGSLADAVREYIEDYNGR